MVAPSCRARYAPHCRYFLERGFRIIVPDLPSVSCGPAIPSLHLADITDCCTQYGRSTGIHSNLTDSHLLTAAVYVVLKDVIEVDVAEGKEQREVFLTGCVD